MKRPLCTLPFLLALAATTGGYAGVEPASAPGPEPSGQPAASDDHRMDWWRDARFGMFIHWGLYAIPAGEWPGDPRTGHAEWIRDSAKIPVDEYEKLKDRFNPVKFDADAWVSVAKAAGMKYVCITTKHHDGFCLFDSAQTDWDVMSTPFHRDIMKEIAEACRRQGMVCCWYHSIMDWHHPDYLPRRPWESRPTDGADFERYNAYLDSQVTELLTHYGPIGVMWFDGQWEGTWTHERGVALYNLCRRLQPGVIVNNRVDKGGGPMQLTRGGTGVQYMGDFGTPEQEIPPTGLPGVDWETCMTMNDHWGYNKRDHRFKSAEDLIRKLADIASKGGNFLLNVGPTAEGEIPPTSIERLREIGRWMRVNGEAIHGTVAGPFERLDWGRCTVRRASDPAEPGVTRLFLHVFNWPSGGELVVPGLYNTPRRAFLLSDPGLPLSVTGAGEAGDNLRIRLPERCPDPIDTVVVLDVAGEPDVATPPVIEATDDIFVGTCECRVSSPRQNIELRYTTDGSAPTPASPRATGAITLGQTATVTARAFRDGRAVSPVARRTFTRVTPAPALKITASKPGVSYTYFEGDWDRLPDFGHTAPAASGTAQAFDLKPRSSGREDRFGFRYEGYVRLPSDGVYAFWIASDDGSNLYVDDRKVIDNDGLHSLHEERGSAALAAGWHKVTVDFFEKTGGHELDVWMSGPDGARRPIDPKEMVSE